MSTLQPLAPLEKNGRIFDLRTFRDQKQKGPDKEEPKDPEKEKNTYGDPEAMQAANYLAGNEEDDLEQGSVEKARESYYDSLKNQKITNLNDLLMEQPEKPELDTAGIEKSGKMARNAAIIQAIDSIAGAAMLQSGQDEAIVAPNDLSNLGFTAVENIQNLEREHKLDLEKYKNQKRQSDRFNSGVRREVSQLNAGIDAQISKSILNDALSEQKKEELEADERKKWAVETGLRYISAGQSDVADEYMKMAGLSNDEISSLIDSYKKQTGSGDNTGSSGYGDNELDSFDISAIKRYNSLMDKVNSINLLQEPGRQGEFDRMVDEMEDIRDKLGKKVYAPKSLWDPQGPAKPAGDLRKVHGDDVIDAAFGGKVEPLGKVDINTEEGRGQFKKYMKNIRTAVDNTENEQEELAIYDQVVRDLYDTGYNDMQVQEMAQYIFGLTPEESEQRNDAADQQDNIMTTMAGPAAGGQPRRAPGPNAGNIPEANTEDMSNMLNSELAKAYENGDMSLEAINQINPLLARSLERNGKMAPWNQLQDMFQNLGSKASSRIGTIKADQYNK